MNFHRIIFSLYISIILLPAFVLSIVAPAPIEKKEELVIVLPEVYEAEEPIEKVIKIRNPRDRYLEELDFINGCYTDSREWFEAYKAINKKYAMEDEIEWIEDVYTEEEILLLERMVETECHGADFDSKTHVAAVVFSRIENERFPDDLIGVITQPNQFCYNKVNIEEETKLACEYAFVIETAADDCLWFHSMSKTEKFSGGNYVFSDNCHHFYE